MASTMQLGGLLDAEEETVKVFPSATLSVRPIYWVMEMKMHIRP